MFLDVVKIVKIAKLGTVSTEQPLPAEWLQPSNRYGWRAILRNALPPFALLGAAPALADINPTLPWLLIVPVGLFLYRITIVMHDCTSCGAPGTR